MEFQLISFLPAGKRRLRLIPPCLRLPSLYTARIYHPPILDLFDFGCADCVLADEKLFDSFVFRYLHPVMVKISSARHFPLLCASGTWGFTLFLDLSRPSTARSVLAPGEYTSFPPSLVLLVTSRGRLL